MPPTPRRPPTTTSRRRRASATASARCSSASSASRRSAGALLDVGCWVGFLLAEARERGWRECVGIEPSAFASEYARRRLGLDVRTEDLFAAELALEHWDVVVMGDVLEHLTRANAALDRVAELLRPGGLLVLELPDAGSRVARMLGPRWWSVIPTHVHYFTRRQRRDDGRAPRLRAAVRGHRPEVVHGPLLPRQGRRLPPGVSRALIGGAERIGVAERMWTPDFRDRMLLIARLEVARGRRAEAKCAAVLEQSISRRRLRPRLLPLGDLRGLRGGPAGRGLLQQGEAGPPARRPRPGCRILDAGCGTG